jgi:endoglucanase
MNYAHVTTSISLIVGLTCNSIGYAAQHPSSGNPQLLGVNLAGAGFGTKNLPGRYGFDYIYPKAHEIDYFIDKGMSIFRMAFRWERIQHQLGGPLDSTELERMTKAVNYATSHGAYVILDIHNYARYHGKVVGGGSVSFEDFAHVWSLLAQHFKGNPQVIIGLMNEPHGMPSEQWRDAANVAIASIRNTGSSHLILVPGNGYSGGHAWYSSWYGTPNAQVMLTIKDPGDNMAFEIHQYFDSDSSGTSPSCVASDTGVKRLAKVTQWMREQGQRAFLGEFAVADNALCYETLKNTLDFMQQNDDVWLGWTWWAAGPWWGDYMFSITPKDGIDKPQMDIIKKYLQRE